MVRRDFRTALASCVSADDASTGSTDNPPNSWLIYRSAGFRVPANRQVIVKWFRLIVKVPVAIVRSLAAS